MGPYFGGDAFWILRAYIPFQKHHTAYQSLFMLIFFSFFKIHSFSGKPTIRFSRRLNLSMINTLSIWVETTLVMRRCCALAIANNSEGLLIGQDSRGCAVFRKTADVWFVGFVSTNPTSQMCWIFFEHVVGTLITKFSNNHISVAHNFARISLV